MTIAGIIQELEQWAPPALQEDYDNCGLLTGNAQWPCTGVLVSLDVTADVVLEARERNCNLIVAHHPILFRGIKRLTGADYVQQTLISAIKADIAIYAIHTNLDNVLHGVNGAMARRLQLTNCRILLPKSKRLQKLYTFVPPAHAETVRAALFAAGAGHIGNYSECSFSHEGTGTFRPGQATKPYSGTAGTRQTDPEIKLEVIFPEWLRTAVVTALLTTHPYEEVAYDIISLENQYQQVGSGLIGTVSAPMHEADFLDHVRQSFNLHVIRHTPLRQKPVQTVALCGGAGSFLTEAAKRAGADIFITSDVKYHEFFDAGAGMVLADIGHWESEQFTIDLLLDFMSQKFPTFAVLKTRLKTNPVRYFSGL